MPAPVAGIPDRTAMSFSSSGMNGLTTDPIIPTMPCTSDRSGMKAYARPELLATTEWLAENLGRAELRVVDVRWRPDGTGRQTFGAGHIPGASYIDWALDLVAEEDQGTLFLLAPPDQV